MAGAGAGVRLVHRHAGRAANVNRRWDDLRRKAGLPWLRLHDLRHGCATFLLAKNVPDRVIMEVLGHAEIGVTMNTYAHVLPSMQEETAKAIEERANALGLPSAVPRAAKAVKVFDPKPGYFTQLRKLIDFAALKKHPK